MLAKNPKNGKDIRIIKSDASAWKDSKTLVWMKDPFSREKKRWKRWDLLVTSVEPRMMLWNPEIVLITEESDEFGKWIKTDAAKKVRFIVVSLKAIKSINREEFDISTLGNVMCLEEFHQTHPYLGTEWTGTIEDAIMCLTIIFRYNKLIGIQPGHERLTKVLFNDLKLTVLEKHKEPEPLVLIQQYYKPNDKKRETELRKCLTKNIECEFVDKIFLFVESLNLQIPPDPEKKIVQMQLKSRLSYADCIFLIQKKIGSGHLVAFANADIYLDETWKSIWSVNMDSVFFALLRWEEDGTLFGPRNDSQDTWLIHSDSVLSRTWDFNAFNIPFGKAGCDNAILVEFFRNRFRVVNPAMSLKTHHVHSSEIRNYDKTDIVDRPVYMFVEPSGLHELNPITSWSPWAGEPVTYDPLERPLKATTAKHLNIFCSQMNRDPSFIWAADGLNTYLPPVGQDRPINISGGAFVSPSGLVYRHTDIYVGTTDIQKSAWSDNRLSHLSASYKVDSMMAFQLDQAWISEPSLFTLHYLSKVIQQNKKTPEASFWCKRTNGLLSAIHLFKWEKAQGRLLEYSPETQVFAQKVVGRTCHGTRPVKVDIDALREAMNGLWCPTIDNKKPTILVVVDLVNITDDVMEKLIDSLEKYGLDLRTISVNADAKKWAQSLSGVSRVILGSSRKIVKDNSWAWLWLAPLGCKVIEMQEERDPSDSLLHLCAAAGLDWTLLQYPRSTPEGFVKIVHKEFNKWLALDMNPVDKPPVQDIRDVNLLDVIPSLIQVDTTPEVNLNLTTVYTPSKSMTRGFFGHKGDSFREMIDLWEEKGYVLRKEDPSLTQCWLGSPGSVLLYDRPTWDWLDKAPANEQAYTKCLTGNPDPSIKTKAVPWIFWPRQPRLVEEFASLPKKTYTERSDMFVFYGRIENEKQGEWRNTEKWEKYCSKFSMQTGTEPYKLNPREYLEALGNAKYGLCLRGFGPKCNREIELLALGTVPIITMDVDISNYDEPLVDGVHVIKVVDGEDAVEQIVNGISEAKWLEMSEAGYQWWKRNCSVEGSWQKTLALSLTE
jgi:hypothetical protein